MDASPRQKSIESVSSTPSREEAGSSSKIKQLVKSNEDIITPSDTSLTENAETEQKKPGSNHSIHEVDSGLNSGVENPERKFSDGVWCGSTGSGLLEDKQLNTSPSGAGCYQEMRYHTPGPRTAYLQSVPEIYKESEPSTNFYKSQLQADFSQQHPRPLEQSTLDEHFVNNVQRPIGSAWQDSYPAWNNVTMPQTLGPRPYPETLQPYPSAHFQEPITRPIVPPGVGYNRPNETMQAQQYSQQAYHIPLMPPAVYNPYVPDVYMGTSSPNERFPEYPRDVPSMRQEQLYRFDTNRARARPDFRNQEMYSRDSGEVQIPDHDYSPNIYDFSAEPPFLRKRGFEQVPFNTLEEKGHSPRRENFSTCCDKGTNTSLEGLMMLGPPKLQNTQSRENVHQRCGCSAMRLSPFDDTNTKPNYKSFPGTGKQVEKDPLGSKPPWRNTYPIKSGGCGSGLARLDKASPPDSMKTFSGLNSPSDNKQKPRYGTYNSPCSDSSGRHFDNRVKQTEAGTSGLPSGLISRPKFTNQGIDFQSNYRTQVCSDKSANKGYTQDSKLPLTPQKYLKDDKVDSATINRIFGNEGARRHFGYFLDDLNAAKKATHRRCSDLDKKAQYRR